MARVEALWARDGAAGRLHRERFVVPVAPPAADGAPARVVLARSGRAVAASPAESLLIALERAGERPAYGCRMGICGTCKTRKRTGSVRNQLTGAVSSEPDEDIQLCISAVAGDVELGL
jgi:stearoyl-CoA 9-desaturase NADPH oxidoreductase